MKNDTIALNGDYNTPQTKNLQIVFVKCDPQERDDCKSDEEIDDWL